MSIKEQLTEVANRFYWEENEAGMDLFMQIAPQIGVIPGARELINPLFDAIEAEDYILAADILQHEVVEKLL